ncbi:hypothetical protein [Streptomyces sp. NPDC058326]|uniref:hypothetical protein n=1 Tax=Streptomyces sp. NPDC058326 TaxID=3346447 RepID=UPI0036E06FAD
MDGATRRQNTYTTPSGTYTITEGLGGESGGTAMPYTRVDDRHWWVRDPESKFYNRMHTTEGADFPLTESGERGSEHLINHPTRYAKALVIDFNRWPAVPGRGPGSSCPSMAAVRRPAVCRCRGRWSCSSVSGGVRGPPAAVRTPGSAE